MTDVMMCLRALVEKCAHAGAERGEKTKDRLAPCNGYRDRARETRAGTAELRIRRLRTGSDFPRVLKPRRMAENAQAVVLRKRGPCAGGDDEPGAPPGKAEPATRRPRHDLFRRSGADPRNASGPAAPTRCTDGPRT